MMQKKQSILSASIIVTIVAVAIGAVLHLQNTSADDLTGETSSSSPRSISRERDTIPSPQGGVTPLPQDRTPLSRDEREMIAPSLAALTEMERMAREHGDDQLLARVEKERRRVLRAAEGVAISSSEREVEK